MEIREYKESDCEELAELFYGTVHTINIKDYSQEQVSAWATGEIDLHKWNLSFVENYTVVVTDEGIIVGFGNLDHAGYLDMLFVHKYYQGQGVATLIVSNIEDYAISRSIDTLCADVSITALPFFEKKGFGILEKQEVKRNGIRLISYKMKKHITSS